MTVDRSHLQCGIRQSRTKCGALRLAAATLFLLAAIPTSSLGPGGSSVTFGPYSLRLHAIKLRRSSLKFAGQALVLRGGDRASGGDNDGQDKMGDSGGSEMDPFDAGEMGGGKSMFPAEDDTKGLTVAEVDALNQVGEGGGIVFLRKGLHNITAGGEIEFQQPLHIAGQNGAQIVAAAQPRPKGSLYPVVGGGRLRLSSVALGSTFSGLTWLNDNVHCVVLERSAALFEACELRCAAGAYVSCIWAAGGSHVSLSRCTVGGFSHERQCTNALLLSASTGALDGSKMEFCFSATVAVNDNSTLRASACALLDSYAALSLTDSVLRQDELETPIEGDVTLLNCTVRTLEFWRGTERPRRFVDEGRINYEMEIHDADHIIEAIETRPTGVVAYDSDKGLWVYQGMSKKSLKQHEAKMERFARPGETKVKDIAKLVRKSLGKKPWESSSEEEDAKAERRLSKTPKHVEDDSSSEEARKAHDWTGYSQRRGHQPGIAQRNLAERYKATHGHPGNPPRQRNRYFAGVSKTEWSGLKGRTRKRRS